MENVTILLCFTIVVLMLTTNVQRVSAAYVPNNGCPPTIANNATCPGTGTTQTIDALASITNGQEKFVLFLLPLVRNFLFVADIIIDYQKSFYGSLIINGIIAFVVSIGNIYRIVFLVNKHVIFTIENTNEDIGGFAGLRGSDLLQALQLIQTPSPYQCNILTPASVLSVPQAGLSKVGFLSFDVSDLVSFQAKTYGGSGVNIKQRAPSVMQQAHGNYYLTQPGSTSELQCLIAGQVIGDFSRNPSGKEACSYTLILESIVGTFTLGLIVPVKFVVITSEKVLVYFVGYVYSFVIENVHNALYPVCG